ncbi:hypothetical protein DL93DRAFT_2231948 [Clavulina sp. PMI_390]|nr:hypothetical protein DL93DRAFT_2231948 [Clavulina sp. PMI_390]
MSPTDQIDVVPQSNTSNTSSRVSATVVDASSTSLSEEEFLKRAEKSVSDVGVSVAPTPELDSSHLSFSSNDSLEVLISPEAQISLAVGSQKSPSPVDGDPIGDASLGLGQDMSIATPYVKREKKPILIVCPPPELEHDTEPRFATSPTPTPTENHITATDRQIGMRTFLSILDSGLNYILKVSCCTVDSAPIANEANPPSEDAHTSENPNWALAPDTPTPPRRSRPFLAPSTRRERNRDRSSQEAGRRGGGKRTPRPSVNQREMLHIKGAAAAAAAKNQAQSPSSMNDKKQGDPAYYASSASSPADSPDAHRPRSDPTKQYPSPQRQQQQQQSATSSNTQNPAFKNKSKASSSSSSSKPASRTETPVWERPGNWRRNRAEDVNSAAATSWRTRKRDDSPTSPQKHQPDATNRGESERRTRSPGKSQSVSVEGGESLHSSGTHASLNQVPSSNQPGPLIDIFSWRPDVDAAAWTAGRVDITSQDRRVGMITPVNPSSPSKHPRSNASTPQGPPPIHVRRPQHRTSLSSEFAGPREPTANEASPSRARELSQHATGREELRDNLNARDPLYYHTPPFPAATNANSIPIDPHKNRWPKAAGNDSNMNAADEIDYEARDRLAQFSAYINAQRQAQNSPYRLASSHPQSQHPSQHQTQQQQHPSESHGIEANPPNVPRLEQMHPDALNQYSQLDFSSHSRSNSLANDHLPHRTSPLRTQNYESLGSFPHLSPHRSRHEGMPNQGAFQSASPSYSPARAEGQRRGVSYADVSPRAYRDPPELVEQMGRMTVLASGNTDGGTGGPSYVDQSPTPTPRRQRVKQPEVDRGHAASSYPIADSRSPHSPLRGISAGDMVVRSQEPGVQRLDFQTSPHRDHIRQNPPTVSHEFRSHTDPHLYQYQESYPRLKTVWPGALRPPPHMLHDGSPTRSHHPQLREDRSQLNDSIASRLGYTPEQLEILVARGVVTQDMLQQLQRRQDRDQDHPMSMRSQTRDQILYGVQAQGRERDLAEEEEVRAYLDATEGKSVSGQAANDVFGGDRNTHKHPRATARRSRGGQFDMENY